MAVGGSRQVCRLPAARPGASARAGRFDDRQKLPGSARPDRRVSRQPRQRDEGRCRNRGPDAPSAHRILLDHLSAASSSSEYA